MFKLKKSAKRVIGATLAGVLLTSGVQINATSPNRTTHTYAEGKIETYDAFEGSVSLCDTEWSDVKESVNKNLLGVIGGKNFGTQEVGPGYFQNNNKYAMYNYYCIANESVVDADERDKGKDNYYDQLRRVYIKDFGMYTSKKNHFPEINDSSKWSVEVLKKSWEYQPEDMWGDATVTLWNKLKCQSCKNVEWQQGPCSDTDKIFTETVNGNEGCLTDIKHYSCPKCGKEGNWKVTSELEMHHDALPKTAVIIVYEKNVPKKKTAKFGTINFYSYLNVKSSHSAGLGSASSNIGIDLTGWVQNGETKKLTVKKGKKMYYSDAFHAPAKLKTSKSSVVSVSNKMGKAGRYLVTAKKKGTATVTATNIWGHKYVFKITVK